MNMLLSCFSYSNCFYEILINESNKIILKKIGKKQTNVDSKDIEIANKILKRIANMKYKFFDTKTYKNERLNLYLNMFNDKIYISKYDNNKEVACQYLDYKELYDMYNKPIIYNYLFEDFQNGFDNVTFDMNFNKLENVNFQSQALNNNGFGNNSSNNSFYRNNGVGTNSSNNSFYGNNGLGTYSSNGNFYGSNGLDTNPLSSNAFESNALGNNTSSKKSKKKKGIKFIKVLCAGVLITVMVVAAVALMTKFGDKTFEENDIEETEVIDIITEDSNDEAIEKIKESLQGEEQWVIDEVIKQYKIDMGIYDLSNDQKTNANTSELSPNAQKLIDSIDSNPYITDEDKDLFKKDFAMFFQNNLQYINNIEDLCEKLRTVKINYDIKESGYGYVNSNGTKVAGNYAVEEHIITLFDNSDGTKTHEMSHAIGNFGTLVGIDKINEGYTERYNPNRDPNTYSSEQTMAIILDQIYGKEFMKKAYFNGSLMFDLFNRFDINSEENKGSKYLDDSFLEHHNFLGEINNFLYQYGAYSIDEIKNNPDALRDAKNILDSLRKKYEELTGKSWEENEILKLCYDRFTGENTSDIHKESEIDDMYVDENGEYIVKLGKRVMYLTPSDRIDMTSYTSTYVTKELKIEDSEPLLD